MDIKSAKGLIAKTFGGAFDKEKYKYFVKNVLNTLDESKTFSYYGAYVPEKFRDFVKGYERIGTYTDPEERKVDVLIVHLKSAITLARARTSQRNFIANYLKERDAKDAGLIAFVSPDPEDWRFSFVKMDYKVVEKKGKFRAEEDFTPAKRYSFLVGSHENSHTAQQQFLPLLEEDRNNPTLASIERAFSIETVTREFFGKYRELFLHLKTALDSILASDKKVKADFEAKDVNTADFAKKLLGQIVFLYFLQKKGWFGVERGKLWGTGPKNFLRQLFDKKLANYKNFFNDILEPLFYEALAVERDEFYYSRFECRIPFLNGGLFDPIGSYDWVDTDITLPNELFSNDVKTQEGDTGNGILDIFDRYNFTVKEDEPLEKEVAVDPEMLGKVFENLLEVNERSAKGTYYTPREIVHYMCQESLINYLAQELGDKISKEDLEVFVRMGDTVIEHESRIVRAGKETADYSFKLPESIRNNAEMLDEKLSTIRVCDPAIGSGAFPVGMMNEIVRARETLTSYLPKQKERNAYDFKRHAIQECLYGVDIDPGAVEIAKLRLWLSLIVDEDDIERIKPLPNLDYRIMQGNSLLEDFEGIRLFDERLLANNAEDKEKQLAEVKAKMGSLQQEYFTLHSSGKLTDVRGKEIQAEIKRQQTYQKQLLTKPEETENMGIFDAPSRVGDVLAELKKLHQSFFEATQRKKKAELKQKIETLEWELVETSLKEKKKDSLLTKLKKTRTRPFFLWKLYFFEVFQQKGGFDIVIANPPYVRHEDIKELKPQLEKAYQVYTGTADLLCYFYELGFKLLHTNGILSFITSNKYLRANYGKPLRQFFKHNSSIVSLIDFGDLPVFEATAYPSIFIAMKGNQAESTFLGCKIETDEELRAFQHVLQEKGITISQDTLPDEDIWNIEKREILDLKKKIEGTSADTKLLCEYIEGKMYRGILTGLNEAFVIDEEIKNRLIKKDSKSAEVIKPFLRGKDIKRYSIDFAHRYLICVPNGWTNHYRKNVEPENFMKIHLPAVFDWLMQFQDALMKRDDQGQYWWELRPCVYTDEFDKPKIVYPEIGKQFNFCIDTNCYFPDCTAWCFPSDDRYILGLLSSKVIGFYFSTKSAQIRGGYLRFKEQYMKSLPIRVSTDKQRTKVEQKVLEVMEQKAKGENTEFIESEIDTLAYEIYGLTDEEIRILEESISS